MTLPNSSNGYWQVEQDPLGSFSSIPLGEFLYFTLIINNYKAYV